MSKAQESFSYRDLYKEELGEEKKGAEPKAATEKKEFEAVKAEHYSADKKAFEALGWGEELKKRQDEIYLAKINEKIKNGELSYTEGGVQIPQDMEKEIRDNALEEALNGLKMEKITNDEQKKQYDEACERVSKSSGEIHEETGEDKAVKSAEKALAEQKDAVEKKLENLSDEKKESFKKLKKFFGKFKNPKTRIAIAGALMGLSVLGAASPAGPLSFVYWLGAGKGVLSFEAAKGAWLALGGGSLLVQMRELLKLRRKKEEKEGEERKKEEKETLIPEEIKAEIPDIEAQIERLKKESEEEKIKEEEKKEMPAISYSGQDLIKSESEQSEEEKFLKNILTPEQMKIAFEKVETPEQLLKPESLMLFEGHLISRILKLAQEKGKDISGLKMEELYETKDDKYYDYLEGRVIGLLIQSRKKEGKIKEDDLKIWEEVKSMNMEDFMVKTGLNEEVEKLGLSGKVPRSRAETENI